MDQVAAFPAIRAYMFRSFFIGLLTVCLSGIGSVSAQGLVRNALKIRLPDSLATGSREFSGLAVSGDRLYLLAENRDDHLAAPTSGIYSISLDEAGRCISGGSRSILEYKYHPLNGIEKIKKKINGYQGLEALVFDNDVFFITVETELFTDSCFLITGRRENGVFEIDTTRIYGLEKPVQPNGEKIFNAGFEALAASGGNLYAFFEYNGFPENFALEIRPGGNSAERLPVRRKISFRLTDAAVWKNRTLLGVNYFFPLKAEAVYQKDLPGKDRELITGPDGGLKPFARLAVLKVKRWGVKLKRFISLPEEYWTSNWEGIARFRKGVLLVNDKFTRDGKHESQLVYVSFEK